MAFLAYDPATHNLNSLVSAIFAGAGGVSLVPGSVAVRYGTIEGQASLSFYDGSLTALNIGSGLLLTSGDSTPPLANNETAYGEALDGDTPGEPDLQATVQAAFPGAGELEDITALQFSIQVSDPAATGLRFDVVFGSDEFPEFSNTSFVDVAGVYVNGVNYALFNRNASQPLSIIDANLTAGNFRDNQGGSLPLEYDGISNRLQITAPLVQGTNTIKIAIADTGDAIYDSGIFVSGLQPVNYAGYGLAQQVAVTGSAQITDSAENQVYQCDNLGNVVLLVSGQDVVDGGGGVDKVKYTFTISGISGYHWDGQVLSVQNGANASTL
ncbi:choice-of-anchor L domain-containing protein, partial [Ramlibacter sp.]|uniref:choice-of-anchor L domain-containing protein n=1 Tax=Ramlibacter sp. TaxID=1917967 RepID=UPI002CAF8012